MAKPTSATPPFLLSPKEILITDSNWRKHEAPKIDGERVSRGLIERDYKKYPVGCYRGCPPMEAIQDLPLIAESEMDERAKEMEEKKTRLSDIILASNGGQGFPSLDQNGQGYCWAYSTVGCVMAVRAVMNQPHVRLSAHAVAYTIKNGRDEGGWGALSMEFIQEKGVPSVKHWAEKSMNGRQYNTPETWENAKLHRITEGWVDLQASVYDRNLTKQQLATCLLCRIPVVVDFNWWGHSVHAVDLVSWNPFRIRIRNSWADSWGERGFGVLEGSKAVPVGGVAVCSVVPSVN